MGKLKKYGWKLILPKNSFRNYEAEHVGNCHKHTAIAVFEL